MTTIIGFVPTNNLNISFPIGFKSDGSQVDTFSQSWPSECCLIFLDDEKFATSTVQGNGLVLVVQHNGNAKNWDKQIRDLEQWGWRPSRIDQYSRIKTISFWRDVLDILSGENNKKKASVIKSMVDRYRDADRIQKLDTVCAWFILSIVDTDAERRSIMEDNVGKILKTFPDDEETVLYNNFNLPDIKGFFAEATKMANKLVSS